MEEYKICSQCQMTFQPRRTDQKFCSLKCKNKCNNKKIKQLYHKQKLENTITKEVHDALMKNRNLLKANCSKEIKIKEFEKQGFTLNICTNFIQLTSDESPLLFCYDFGYQFLDDSTIQIFKKHN